MSTPSILDLSNPLYRFQSPPTTSPLDFGGHSQSQRKPDSFKVYQSWLLNVIRLKIDLTRDVDLQIRQEDLS